MLIGNMADPKFLQIPLTLALALTRAWASALAVGFLLLQKNDFA